jgi:hypothetical protein
MRYLISTLLLFPLIINAQSDTDYEVGLEIGNFSFSTITSSVDMAVKFAIVNDEELAYGPILRTKFWRSNNIETGFVGSQSFFGFGGFLHYRTMEWFYLGTEIEYNRNSFANMNQLDDRQWNLAAFIGGGIHRNLGESNFHLNAGMMFDLVDALRDPLTTNPSNFSSYYFLRRSNPQNPGAGGQFVPLIYRITFLYRLPI